MLLTKRQAINYLPVSYSGLEKMIKRNELPYIKIGARIYFESEVLGLYLKNQRNDIAINLCNKNNFNEVDIDFGDGNDLAEYVANKH